MILYQLRCDKDHTFEAWFSGSEAYEKQVSRNLVTCPHCGSSQVSKAIMAPNIGVKTNRKQKGPARPAATPPQVATAPQHGANAAITHSETPQAWRETMAVARKIREAVEKNAEYVGPKFAEEARKIHYHEVEEKGIYGEASAQEVKELIEEGVDVRPLPILPEDQN